MSICFIGLVVQHPFLHQNLDHGLVGHIDHLCLGFKGIQQVPRHFHADELAGGRPATVQMAKIIEKLNDLVRRQVAAVLQIFIRK